MYNGKFNQTLEISIKCNDHSSCLRIANVVKKQCDAWYFSVRYDESKSARKGDVLKRSIMIYQTSYASDILIFKEAMRIVCFHLNFGDHEVIFNDMGVEPENRLRQDH